MVKLLHFGFMSFFRYRPVMVLLLVAGVLSIGGCAGYRLGNIPRSDMAGVKTIHVPVIRNDSLEPSLPVMTTNAILRELDNDGTYHSSRSRMADAVLEVRIVKYYRTPLRRSRDNSLVPNEYEVTLTANATLTNLKTGTILFKDRVFEGKTAYFIQLNSQEVERQANPLAAKDLARHIVSAITEGW